MQHVYLVYYKMYYKGVSIISKHIKSLERYFSFLITDFYRVVLKIVRTTLQCIVVLQLRGEGHEK